MMTNKKGGKAPAVQHELAIDRSGGFSLFEALITIVVISIGLLGLAGLQFAGLRAVNDAYEHTVAIHYAQDIIERLRANRAGVNATLYDNVYNGAPIISTSAVAFANCQGVLVSCNSTSLFNFDAYQWYLFTKPESGEPVLPNLSIRLQKVGSVFTLTLTWGDAGSPRTLITKAHASL